MPSDKTTERREALKLAARILDSPEDPDHEEAILARQLLRGQEVIDRLKKDFNNLHDPEKDLIQANQEELARKQSEALTLIRVRTLNSLKRGPEDWRATLVFIGKVFDSLALFHPMHSEAWPGWPEGVNE